MLLKKTILFHHRTSISMRIIIFRTAYAYVYNPYLHPSRLQTLACKMVLDMKLRKSLIFILQVMSISFTQAGLISTSEKESNFGLDVLQLATKYGYPSKKYEIVTEDSYVLQMERIPYGKTYQTIVNRPAVLLVSALLTGSVTFANFGPQKSLAFILADNGYDVWLLNYRGTTHSRKHVYLDPDVDKRAYWNYSFPEIATYDIPAAIDKILFETKQESLFYIGHSLGCANLFALLAENPNYNQKVKLMVAMAPVLQLNHTTKNIFTVIGLLETEIQVLADLFQDYEVLPNSYLFKLAAKIFCSNVPVVQDICATFFLLAVGYSPRELDKSQLPVIISTTPAGSSIKSVLHSAQLYKTGRFAKYDYGPSENMLHYGQAMAPIYDVSRITTPIAIFYGGKDVLVGVKDIVADAQMLPSLHSKTFFPEFNHVDFLWGIDAPSKLYPKIIELMNSFINK